jgi:hypothetical protein
MTCRDLADALDTLALRGAPCAAMLAEAAWRLRKQEITAEALWLAGECDRLRSWE